MKSMLDEWGEEIENVKDEGVFTETSLGSFPNTNSKTFPYASEMTRSIEPVSANKFALVDRGDGVRQTQVLRATAGCCGGMGSDWDIDALPGYSTAGEAAESSRWGAALGPDPGAGSKMGGATYTGGGGGSAGGGSSVSATDIAGAVRAGIGGIMDIVGGSVSAWQSVQETRMDRRQASAEIDLLMERLRQQGASASEIAQAQQVQSSGDVAAMMALLESQRRPVWPWIVGGAALLGVAGLAIFAITKDGK